MDHFACPCAAQCGICEEKTQTQLTDRLTGALIGLARATDGNEHLISDSSTDVILEGLAAVLTQGESELRNLLERAREEKRKMVPNCFTCASPCGRTADYDMQALRTAPEDIRTLKSWILFALRGAAAYAVHAARLGHRDEAVNRFFYKALNYVGMDYLETADLLSLALEIGRVSITCGAMAKAAAGKLLRLVPGENCPLLVTDETQLQELKRLLEQRFPPAPPEDSVGSLKIVSRNR